MKHKLIKTDNYLLIVDDSEIKEGECYLSPSGIWFYNHLNPNHVKDCKKIIAHLPLNNSPILEGVTLLPPLNVEDDNKELFYQKQVMNPYPTECQSYTSYEKGFIEGYNKAKESERNNLTPFKNLIVLIENGLLKGTIETNLMIDQEINVCKDYLKKLSQPKLPTYFEVEMGTKYFEDSRWETHPIFVENQEGQTVILGRYTYGS